MDAPPAADIRALMIRALALSHRLDGDGDCPEHEGDFGSASDTGLGSNTGEPLRACPAVVNGSDTDGDVVDTTGHD